MIIITHMGMFMIHKKRIIYILPSKRTKHSFQKRTIKKNIICLSIGILDNEPNFVKPHAIIC